MCLLSAFSWLSVSYRFAFKSLFLFLLRSIESPEFRAVVGEWAEKGSVQPWEGPFGLYDGGGATVGAATAAAAAAATVEPHNFPCIHYCGTGASSSEGGMSNICNSLLASNDKVKKR